MWQISRRLLHDVISHVIRVDRYFTRCYFSSDEYEIHESFYRRRVRFYYTLFEEGKWNLCLLSLADRNAEKSNVTYTEDVTTRNFADFLKRATPPPHHTDFLYRLFEFI